MRARLWEPHVASHFSGLKSPIVLSEPDYGSPNYNVSYTIWQTMFGWKEDSLHGSTVFVKWGCLKVVDGCMQFMIGILTCEEEIVEFIHVSCEWSKWIVYILIENFYFQN